MTAEHTSEHQRLLDRFLHGEWSLDHPELQALRDSCAQCREELDSLARTGQALDASAVLEAEVLRQGMAAATDADEALVQAHMQDLWSSARLRRRRLWGWSSVAAAAGLFLWLSWGNPLRWGVEDTGPGERMQVMGRSEGKLVGPIGPLEPGSAFDSFSWEVDLAPGESLTLRVWSENALEPTILVERLRTSSWTPSADQLRDMGSSIEWELQHLSGGVPIDTYGGSASLQP